MGRAVKLTSKWDFEAVFNRGKVIKNENFVVYTLPGKTQEIRVGICVGKTLGSAVTRNRLRRQIWEIVRQLDFTGSGIDVVTVARKKVIGCDFNHIKESLLGLFSRSQLL